MAPHPTEDATVRWRTWHLHLPSWGVDVTDRALNVGVTPAVARYASAPAPAPAPVVAPGVRADGSAAPRGGEHPWFFVRYWQGGPHLRLRIAGLDDEAAEGVEDLLRRAVATVDAEVPAERRLTQADYAAAVGALARTGEGTGPLDPGALRPSGVVRAAYVPEHERYGGAGLMPLSEDLFHRSSALALGACREPRTRRQVFGQALAATAVAAGALPEPERRPFLEAVRDGWAAWLTAHDRNDERSVPPAPAEPGTVPGVSSALRAQADRLRSAAPELRRLMRDPGPPWEAWAAPLRAAVDTWSTAPGGRERALGVLGSHLHMTLNRLGAGTAQEARLATLMLLVTGESLP
ncbi:thiopeptide-type bacteriocin biosynthesis protein [Streptomyces actuosus]|uniref:Thiopeptide-type bacteriocin biosynthesis protein n=1 Tax=Streptomyces actuosus TaxID=1885 RepID=A0ABS2VYF9_STRAS|nr:thiopeptide-type bacteriocin biosynthesis protein [Streptomyces actuosus]MBN0048020.1 thiopeptide-type bacteriocin biosynthesis protein [Streptomyces actuosus]